MLELGDKAAVPAIAAAPGRQTAQALAAGRESEHEREGASERGREGERHGAAGEREGRGAAWRRRVRRWADPSPPAPCGLHTLLLRVAELGLGYDSEETVLFRYCGGGCPRARSNHDLALSSLLQRGALPPPTRLAEPPHSAPCCRPSRHEDLAFLDSAHRWHRVERLSAAACSCVG
ncbi:persephin [Amia ocellicauda]|uniref:persephin n=1 Tax=Amia ocellicauda TaxID=2972642 RepID=UPI00346412E7